MVQAGVMQAGRDETSRRLLKGQRRKSSAGLDQLIGGGL